MKENHTASKQVSFSWSLGLVKRLDIGLGRWIFEKEEVERFRIRNGIRKRIRVDGVLQLVAADD